MTLSEACHSGSPFCLKNEKKMKKNPITKSKSSASYIVQTLLEWLLWGIEIIFIEKVVG